jgi:hypothetical protein
MDRYLPSPRQIAQWKTKQVSHSLQYVHILHQTQSSSGNPVINVSLTYRPIAKNIRQLATALHYATSKNMRLKIVDGNKSEEASLLAEGHGHWHPWLWGRIDRAKTNQEQGQCSGESADSITRSWLLYFSAVPGRALGEAGDSPHRAPQPPFRGRVSANHRRILEMSVCCAETFCLNESVMDQIKGWKREMDWPDDKRILGLHIRRGDAASENLGSTTRHSHHLEEYMDAADRMCSLYDIETLYISTESQLEIDRARQLRPSYRIFALPHDRRIFPRIDDSSKFIEHAALQNPDIIEPLVISALADLYFLQESHAFIGTFNSEFSMLAWLLCVGRHRHLVPYLDLTTGKRLRSFQGNLDFWTHMPTT